MGGLPATEGRTGRASTSALDAHSAPSSPPRALGQNASLRRGHQPSQLEECSPLPPAVPLCLFRADDNRDGAYGPQSHRAFWESDTGTRAWREGPWALEHSFSLCSSQGHRSPLLSLLKRSKCRKNAFSRQPLKRAGVGRAHIQGGHVGAKTESHLASPASAPPPTA